MRQAATTVAVAQLVESRIVIPVVVGSNPISHPILCDLNSQLRRTLTTMD